ncbi:nucleotide exchange factor GrpE [Naasia sp. SYSU D00948]|uniref:nucleotide exchange factor GrpE n=1 Tax=Naasia sp. SYSU D00948 TaxID=2817379 RepID=UPI001B303691|nr:nucleotide exchange factor GrpE [Naasia sp. SYSU D00948]
MADKDDEKQPEPEGRAENPRDPSGGPEFVSMEGPDIETPTGENGGDDAFSPEDLSFLEDVSAGTAAGSTAPTEQVDEHLADLKRVSAEYANYRRRTEANRQIERDRAVGDVVRLLLPVLDDLDRAEKHGDLTEGGPLTTIAQKLRASVERIGLVGFGEAGESFDPAHHEALFQKPNPEVTAPTVADVIERGYRIGDVTLRAAKVVVDTPAD